MLAQSDDNIVYMHDNPAPSATPLRRRKPNPTDALMDRLANDQAVNDLIQSYLYYIGAQPPRLIIILMLDMHADGFSIDTLQYAIDQTALAPRPSAQYCAAILRRLQREQRRTLDTADRYAYQSRNPALNYQQRSPDEISTAGLFLDLDHYRKDD